MKLPFRRDNSDSENLPTEIKEYYQTERRERVGVAWLLALGTLVLTLILATGLFFGGRWAYRKIAGTDKPANVSQTESSDQSDTQGETSSPTTTSTEDATGTSSATTSTPSTAPQASSPTPAPQPTVAANSTTLPNTGPGEVLGVFASVTAAGTVAHSVMLSRRKRS